MIFIGCEFREKDVLKRVIHKKLILQNISPHQSLFQ